MSYLNVMMDKRTYVRQNPKKGTCIAASTEGASETFWGINPDQVRMRVK